MKIFLCSTLLLCEVGVFVQSRVDLENRHERVIAIVPMIGTRTSADPRRPLFAPAPNEFRVGQGIIEYQWTPSDDGKYAVVEFVAKTRRELAHIVADSR